MDLKFFADDSVEINGTGRRYEITPMTLCNTDVYSAYGGGCLWNVTPIKYTEYEGLMFGNDECFGGSPIDYSVQFYQWFLCDGALYSAWYDTVDSDGNQIPLDEIDYTKPQCLLFEGYPYIERASQDLSCDEKTAINSQEDFNTLLSQPLDNNKSDVQKEQSHERI